MQIEVGSVWVKRSDADVALTVIGTVRVLVNRVRGVFVTQFRVRTNDGRVFVYGTASALRSYYRPAGLEEIAA